MIRCDFIDIDDMMGKIRGFQCIGIASKVMGESCTRCYCKEHYEKVEKRLKRDRKNLISSDSPV